MIISINLERWQKLYKVNWRLWKNSTLWGKYLGMTRVSYRAGQAFPILINIILSPCCAMPWFVISLMYFLQLNIAPSVLKEKLACGVCCEYIIMLGRFSNSDLINVRPCFHKLDSQLGLGKIECLSDSIRRRVLSLCQVSEHHSLWIQYGRCGKLEYAFFTRSLINYCQIYIVGCIFTTNAKWLKILQIGVIFQNTRGYSAWLLWHFHSYEHVDLLQCIRCSIPWVLASKQSFSRSFSASSNLSVKWRSPISKEKIVRIHWYIFDSNSGSVLCCEAR